MSSLARSVVLGLVLLTGAQPLWAASKAEDRAFSAATQAFRDAFWERADRELGAFVANYPKSESRAEAVLLQAEARIKAKNFAGAIELLEGGRATAGRLGDEYLFWLAEAQLQSGHLEAAADLYGRFAVEFSGSQRLLEAVVAEASVRAQLKQWSRVTDLLQNPSGVFQTRAKDNPTQPNVVRGRFLLAKTQFEQGQLKDAEAALLPLANQALDPKLAWQRDHLLASIQLADDRADVALTTATNLPAIGTNEMRLFGEGLALQGRIYEKLQRTEEAIATWQRILTFAEAPTERQREALLRVSELLLAQGRVEDSLQTLDGFLAKASNSPVADIAWLAVGELRLRQFTEPKPAATNGPVTGTNLLPLAQGAFDTLLTRFPQSPLAGKAQLGRGWCLWLSGRSAESGAAFEAAARSLADAYDQAVARFKLADTQMQGKNFAEALKNYRAVVTSGATSLEFRSNLVERALYQILQAARAAGDDAAAGEAMTTLLREFPESSLAESGLLAFGSRSVDTANPATRRVVLEEFLTRDPDSKLAPVVRLAVARTYEHERNWPKAAEAYADWLKAYPDHAARPRAEYFRALATARSGDDTNAVVQFTEFVTVYPTNEFSAQAQWWIADHYWRDEDFVNAERNYQLLVQNYPQSKLHFEAQLAAGRAALARQRPDEAAAYFRSLISDTNCPPDVEARAYFANGDVLMASSPGETNAPSANYVEAIKSFRKVQQLHPDTEIAMLAEGKIGECYLQLGATDPARYKDARDAFEKVLGSKANVAARSQAQVGLALVLEKQGLPTSSASENVVLQQALEDYLDVVYGKKLRANEESDPFWVKRAGLEACRVAESLQAWEQLSKLCTTLSEMLPPLRPQLEKKKARADEQLRKRAD